MSSCSNGRTGSCVDLDPDESVPFEAVTAAADAMRQALEAFDLASFPLLTGGKGIHVVVPVEPERAWSEASAFAHAVAGRFADAEPDRYVATMSKARRKGRIFIDHFRNDRGATAIAPFSPRARPGAPIAWPVDWADLADIPAANVVTIGNAADHRPGRLWSRYATTRQRIGGAALKGLGIA